MKIMQLKYIKVFNNSSYDVRVKELFERAFPLEERPPFEMLLSFNNDLFAIYNNDQFIGLIDLVFYEDLIYIFFFAIEDQYRHQGYGSNILQQLINKYQDKRIFLMAEEIGDDYINILERKSRIAFYKKNGLHLTNLIINEFDVRYHVLINHKEIIIEDYCRLIKYTIGEMNYNNYYSKHLSFDYLEVKDNE